LGVLVCVYGSGARVKEGGVVSERAAEDKS